ncbi:hypothetical protein [Thalassolituus sp.]|jgi:hypothetical protein|uniref:hypothetical protein n=1 Tax=Thalassolituus sp. TaxID=2030822 RepID=UPI0032D8F49E
MTTDLYEPNILNQWQVAWPDALAVWSQFTRLSDPRLCESSVLAAKEGLNSSFAMIRLSDQSVVIDLEAVQKFDLNDYAVEVLAHEIGHHVLAPATASDHFRLLARIRRGLPTFEQHAAMIANLYTDLLINDRLQRHSGLRMDGIYRRILAKEPMRKPSLWALYMRIYEVLWQLDAGALGVQVDDSLFNTHAWLGARLIRVYANDWLTGGARFAALILPYLYNDSLEQEQQQVSALNQMHDTREAGHGSEPSGLVDYDAEELDEPLHPSDDPLITGEEDKDTDETPLSSLDKKAVRASAGQRREPFEYGEILRSAGLKLSDHDVAVRYYREAALPYLIPFPKRIAPQSMEPQIEGLETWEMGDALDEVDWMQTLSSSPVVVPGVTTVKRQYGLTSGAEPATKPVDLDIYIDSSGSMPNPQQRMSYMALAGAVICLSALRSGSRVQATLWSGKNQFISTPGFVRDEDTLLKIITGHFGGATAFPIHKLRETFTARTDFDRDCHILHLSDDGITTMFDIDELGCGGWDVSRISLERGRAGGTMALNLRANWRDQDNVITNTLKQAESEQDWNIYTVTDLPQLLDFARDFSRKHYGSAKTVKRR